MEVQAGCVGPDVAVWYADDFPGRELLELVHQKALPKIQAARKVKLEQ